MRQVEGIAELVLLRQDRNALAVRIHDDADGISKVKRPGLLRNVACREILAEEAFEMAALGFVDHLAGAVGLEPVDHHPVVTDDGADQPRRIGGQFLQRGAAQSAAQHRADHVERLGAGAAAGLEFDHDFAAGAVQRDVEQAPAEIEAEEQDGTSRERGIGKRIAQGVRRLGAEDLLDAGPPQHGSRVEAEHVMRVGGMAGDRTERRIACDQRPVRLDGAGDMDRLAIAVREINRCVQEASSRRTPRSRRQMSSVRRTPPFPVPAGQWRRAARRTCSTPADPLSAPRDGALHIRP